MRVARIKDVLFDIAHLLGIDPTSADFTATEHVNKWISFLNRRTNEAWRFWDWPEIRVTEERAFRTIWNSTKTFKRQSTTDPNRLGLVDQLFYITTFKYYQVKSTAVGDPPAATLPTNTTYFEEISIGSGTDGSSVVFDAYIDLDQGCRRSIGEVIGVYNADPRAHGGIGTLSLPFRLSQRGIEVYPTYYNASATTGAASGLTAFVTFKIRPSKFSGTLWSASSVAYKTGDIRYYDSGSTAPYDGFCYYALQDHTSAANNAPSYAGSLGTNWQLVPLPERFAEFVKCSVAADAADDTQTKAKLFAEAGSHLEGEADGLIRQGGLSYYQPTATRNVWLPLGTSGFLWSIAAPWTGGTTSETTTLTDTCVDTYQGHVISTNYNYL